MLDENFNRLKRPSNIHVSNIFLSIIHSFFYFQNGGVQGAVVMVLTELVDSDDEKPLRGKKREWIKRRRESGYFQNIFLELKFEDQTGFKDMFRISVTDYKFLISQICDLILPNERIGGNRPILADERLVLTLRYLAAGEPFQSFSYQFRISLVAVSYIVKGCCSAINHTLQNLFIELPNSREKWLEISRKFEQRWNYPHALGAIDGKHVKIVKPNNGGSYFYNYKHMHSIILLATASPECE